MLLCITASCWSCSTGIGPACSKKQRLSSSLRTRHEEVIWGKTSALGHIVHYLYRSVLEMLLDHWSMLTAYRSLPGRAPGVARCAQKQLCTYWTRCFVASCGLPEPFLFSCTYIHTLKLWSKVLFSSWTGGMLTSVVAAGGCRPPEWSR